MPSARFANAADLETAEPRETMRNGVLSWLCVLGAGLVLGGVATTGPATRASDPDARPAESPAAPFFAQYCQSCHAGAKPKGNFRLDQLSLDFDNKANRERWLAVLEQLKAGTMPPPEKPQPKAQEARILTEWISGRVDGAVAARNASQGRVALRRLNRAEYENTVRDLLGIEVDLKDFLPPEAPTNGFDNSAEALHVSSFLMESYLEAADRV